MSSKVVSPVIFLENISVDTCEYQITSNMKLNNLEKSLQKLVDALVALEPRADKISTKVHESNRLSAKNLLRYLTLRTFDLRKIHDSLSELGISSLRSSEAYVYHNTLSALQLVRLLSGKKVQDEDKMESIGYRRSKKLLKKNANTLFNRVKRGSNTEIMVTLPTEAASDPDLIPNLMKSGMEVARINLSHDGEEIWQAMVEKVKAASKSLKIPCKIYMDLPGPKIRTGSINIEQQDAEGNSKQTTFIRLNVGDHLILSKKDVQAEPVIRGEKNELLSPARIAITLPDVLDQVKIGDRILFDDGKIASQVIRVEEEEAHVVIKRTPKDRVKLKPEKGVNLPDTTLKIHSLTDLDRELIKFAVHHADMIGYSFVKTPEDVKELHEELDKYNAEEMGVILKIENKDAVENLPLMLIEAMKRPKVGVMIARGDLAVEIGFERIAEIQDQIMWICEAAHTPVIWATQVFETMAKKGNATKAEVTDAASSARAECVMLNKGPYVVQTVKMLKAILIKMQAHYSKKKSKMRSLAIAERAMSILGIE